MVLLTANGEVSLVSKQVVEGQIYAYDLTVENAHTFFVGASQVWVHNCPDPDTGDDIHRIGGSSADNLALKDAEKKLNPPGISVLKADSPGEAAKQMRDAFPNAKRLHEASKCVGSSCESKIKAAGFELMPDKTKKFPNHHRITHPEGAAGFSPENLKRLSDAFTDTVDN